MMVPLSFTEPCGEAAKTFGPKLWCPWRFWPDFSNQNSETKETMATDWNQYIHMSGVHRVYYDPLVWPSTQQTLASWRCRCRLVMLNFKLEEGRKPWH